MEWLSDNLLTVFVLGILVIITYLFLKSVDKKNKKNNANKNEYIEITEELADSLSDKELLDRVIANRLAKYEESDENQQKFIFTRKTDSVLTWNKEQDVVFFVWLTCMHLKKNKSPGDKMERRLVKSLYGEVPIASNAFLDVGAEKCAKIFNDMTGDSFDVSKSEELKSLIEQEKPLDLCGKYIRNNLSMIAQQAVPPSVDEDDPQ